MMEENTLVKVEGFWHAKELTCSHLPTLDNLIYHPYLSGVGIRPGQALVKLLDSVDRHQ